MQLQSHGALGSPSGREGKWVLREKDGILTDSDIPESHLSFWTRGVLVFDTSALVRLHEYPSQYAEQAIRLMYAFQNRLLTPDAVMSEYSKASERRSGEIGSEYAILEKIVAKHLLKVVDSPALEQYWQKLRNHPYASAPQLEVALSEAFTNVIERLVEAERIHREGATGDRLAEALETLLEETIGDPFTVEAEEKVKTEADEVRRPQRIPPGFCDDGYGDLLIWHQVLSDARAKNTNVVFVTEDHKADWWTLDSAGERQGARIELAVELMERQGSHLLMLSLPEFIGEATEQVQGGNFDCDLDAMSYCGDLFDDMLTPDLTALWRDIWEVRAQLSGFEVARIGLEVRAALLEAAQNAEEAQDARDAARQIGESSAVLVKRQRELERKAMRSEKIAYDAMTDI